jgi:hypothetical protein
MKLFAKIVSDNETHQKYAPEAWIEAGWYEIDREPERDEYLSFDPELKTIVIKKREKTTEQVAAAVKKEEDAALFTPATMRDLLKRVEALEKKG